MMRFAIPTTCSAAVRSAAWGGMWLLLSFAVLIAPRAIAAEKPNIVIVVADDLGWRDCGYHGNDVIKTPNLDDMAAKGLRFDYFYPGQQMCSPGRFAIMSGRNPFRTGLHHLGSTRPQEVFLPRVLKQVGYKTAHFGKWHLGSGASSPVGMGFDQALWSPNYFDLGARMQINDTKEKTPELPGDSSVGIMDHALRYIGERAKESQPFFVQVCFGSPHSPHQAADEFKAQYKDVKPANPEFLGEVSGLDAAVGNLRTELRKLNIADNTIVWFTSDNGGITQQSMDPTGRGKMTVGCRTQGALEWPAKIKPTIATMPCAHVDIYPTLLEIVGVKAEVQPVLDGISLVPLIEGQMTARPKPLGFLLWNGKQNFAQIDFAKDTQGVWIDGSYKLIVDPEREAVDASDANEKDDGKESKKMKKKAKENKKAKGGGKQSASGLYDIHADPAEKNNLASQHPEIVERMRNALRTWQQSVRDSYDGKDFAKK